ncbi:MAG: glycoside hydrolase family 2 protein [Deltaproteobacteria bacterium]|nr:glycoside hydrolase family 2 protein [Deltaproteobacteria bacterium]
MTVTTPNDFDFVQHLNDGWEYTWVTPSVVTNPNQLLELSPVWHKAIVPGTVAGSERASGIFNYGATRYDEHEYWYRCRVRLPEGDRVQFNFAGLATIAEVFWNDTVILASDNMFLPQTVDATPLVKDGTLYIRFRAVDEALERKLPRPKWRTRLVENQQLRWIRRTLLGRIPGWSPPTPPTGPWRGISITANMSVAHEIIEAKQFFNPSQGHIVLTIRLQLLLLRQGRLDQAYLAIDDRSYAMTVSDLKDHSYELSCSIVIQSQDFWWPHTHGEPKLFQLRVTYNYNGNPRALDIGTTGFRHLEVDQREGNFRVILNGEPIYCRGACWTPIDPINYASDKKTMQIMLGAAKDAGMNMLRLVGSMVYETPDFYQECDRLGILIWQDFMFSNLDYPFQDDTFRSSAASEVTTFLNMTTLSPCITILCGNSDIEQQTAMLGLPRAMWRPSFFARELPALVKTIRPDAIYVPSSPSGGDLPFETDQSISHYYGVGAYLRPLMDARLASVKFAAECLGFANVPDATTIDSWLKHGETPPTHPRWKERVPRDSGASWDFDDVRDHYLKLLFGVDPLHLRYANLDRYLFLSRITSGEVMLRTIQEWRRVGSSCSGSIVWWLKDLWPGPGWGVIDANCRPKAAYHFLRRAMAPITIFFIDEGLNGLDLHVINESPEQVTGELAIEFLNADSVSVGRYTSNLTCEGRSSLKLRGAAITDHFNDASYAYRFGPPAHNVVRATWKESTSQHLIAECFHFPAGYDLPKASHLDLTYTLQKVDDRHWHMHLMAQSFIQYLHLELPHCKVSDNDFHLYPNSPRVIQLELDQDQSAVEGQISSLNATHSLTIRPNS